MNREGKKLNGAGLSTLWTLIKNLVGGKTVDGVPLSTGKHYAVCSTAASTSIKSVTLTGFQLVTGAEVTVRFSVTNTAAVGNLRLNVNSTGSRYIRYRNAVLPSAGVLATGRTYRFVYDGTYWQLTGDLDTDTTYSEGTAELLDVSYTDMSYPPMVWHHQVLHDYIDRFRIKPLGRAENLSLSQQCKQCSLVIAGGKTYLSNKATTGLPDCVLEYGGEMVTHDGEAVIHGEAGSDWDLIAEREK